jgi:hypothetical protein
MCAIAKRRRPVLIDLVLERFNAVAGLADLFMTESTVGFDHGRTSKSLFAMMIDDCITRLPCESEAISLLA